MNSSSELQALKGTEYIKALKSHLPKEAFSPAPKKVWHIALNLSLLGLAYFLFRFTDNVGLHLVLSLFIAHILACIGFLSHELSHNSIIRSHYIRYSLEVVSWGINLIPATLWDKVHNQTHHAHMNTIKDPDRQFLYSEESFMTKAYTKIFYPNRKFFKWNPLVALHFIPYITRNIISAFYPSKSKPDVVPYKPKYTQKQKAKIAFELVVIALIQLIIFLAVGSNLEKYFWAAPVSYLLTSSILMAYIFTNHFINPMCDISDPLLTTTSVKVPAIFNKLHYNFSYHTEHHIFPSVNSEYYPIISKLLQDKFPEKYNYIPISEAWKKLWKNEEFLAPPVPNQESKSKTADSMMNIS